MSITNETLYNIMQTRYEYLVEHRDNILNGGIEEISEGFYSLESECFMILSAYDDIIEQLTYDACNDATFEDYNPLDDDYRIAFCRMQDAFYKLGIEFRALSKKGTE